MGSKVVSGRVPEELAEWADRYASERGVKRGELVQAALENLREDSKAGVPGLRAKAVEQAARSGALQALQGVGDCPKRPGELGHVFKPPSQDPDRACSFCGRKGRSKPGGEDEGFFAEATMARSDLFRGLRTPDSVTGRRGKS